MVYYPVGLVLSTQDPLQQRPSNQCWIKLTYLGSCMWMSQIDSFHALPALAFGPSPQNELCPKVDLELVFLHRRKRLCNGTSWISSPVEWKTKAQRSREIHVQETFTTMVHTGIIFIAQIPSNSRTAIASQAKNVTEQVLRRMISLIVFSVRH